MAADRVVDGGNPAGARRIAERLVIAAVAISVGVGDYHLALTSVHLPHSVALGTGIFLGIWAAFALRLRRV